MSISERIIKIVGELLAIDVAEITPSTDLIIDLGIDELDYVELIMTVEEEFDLEISDEDAGMPDLGSSRDDKGGLWRTGEDAGGLRRVKFRRIQHWVDYVSQRASG
jgi:acyl carrier protein